METKQSKEKKESSSVVRSPLKNLNGFSIHKPKINNSSNPSSSFSSKKKKLPHIHGKPTNQVKKGPEETRNKVKNARVSDLGSIASNSGENRTPLGRFGDKTVSDNSAHVKFNGNDENAVKTPPLEVSISPEIQSQSHSKMPVMKSARGPVCYGTGHLLSGVTDKRKCRRRRGSLKGGVEKVDLLKDDSQPIPFLVEASVNWHLSPCKDRSEQSRKTVCDADVVLSDALSSPSTLCRDGSDLLCDEISSYGDSASFSNIEKTRRNKASLVISPNATEVYSLTETIEALVLGSRLEDMVPSPSFCDPNNVDSISSWLSDATLDSLVPSSRMRISWRDELGSRNFETEEFDCCCLSDDEEIIGNGSTAGKVDDSHRKETTYLGFELGDDKENDLSPMLLDYEPFIPARGKEKCSSHRADDTCAESICTEGGGLAVSDDSDWVCGYENDLFHD